MQSVFLNILAEAMVNAEKAEYATKETAAETEKKYKTNILVLSKFSEKYAEICPRCPGTAYTGTWKNEA